MQTTIIVFGMYYVIPPIQRWLILLSLAVLVAVGMVAIWRIDRFRR